MNALGGTVKATRAELTILLEKTRAELAAANSLLAAIAELAVVPQAASPLDIGDYDKVQRIFQLAQRDRAIRVSVAASLPAGTMANGYVAAEKVLREGACDLGYEPSLPETDESAVQA